MKEWNAGLLSDVAEIIMGQSPKGDICNHSGIGIPLLNGPTEFGIKNPIPIQFTEDPKKVSAKNDILFCVRGSTTGRMNWADQQYAIGRGIAAIRHKDGDDYKYFIKGIIDFSLQILLASATGSTFPNVSRSQLEELEILIPPLPEQKAIAKVLSSLDDKIDLLHRQNKTLEAMAETLFRQWVVEEARENWEEVTLGECCTVITKGTTPTNLKKGLVSNGINFIKVNCIDENGNFLIDKFQFIDEETNDLLSRSKLEEGDILYSIAGTIGRLIIVDKEILPANVNQALAIIRVNSEKINPVFIKYCLKDREINENLHSKVVHAVQPNLSLGEISKTNIPFPPKEVMKQFKEMVDPIELKLKNNKSQIRNLEKLRDTLLPKLMSGEVRVEVEHKK